jgi:diguanylate cyclase (GGDEF)-like protein/PAS domain S-box-containing protein
MTTTQDQENCLNRLHEIIDACPVPMSICDFDQNILFLNAEFIHTFGYTLEDIQHMDAWRELAYPDPEYRQSIRQIWKNNLQQFLHDRNYRVPIEARIQCKDGQTKTILARVAPLGNEFDHLYLITLIDITRQIESSKALAETNRFLHYLIETIPMRVFWKDTDARYLGCNTLFAKDGGKQTPEELIGKDDHALAWKNQADLYRADDQAVMANSIAKIGYEEPQTTPDGRKIWLRTSKVPLRNNQGEIIGVLGVYDDVTSDKNRSEELLQAEARYHLLFDHSPVPMCVLDTQTLQFLDVNDAALQQFGYLRDEVKNITILDLLFPEDIQLFHERMQEELQHPDRVSHQLFRNRKKDGTAVWMEISGHNILYADRAARILQGHDVTKRIEVEQHIRAMEARYRLLFDASPVPIGVFDVQSLNILAFNDAALALYGYSREEALHQSAMEIYYPEDRPQFLEHLAQELQDPDKTSTTIARNRRKDGSAIWVEVKAHHIEYDGRPARIAQMFDITQRLQMEKDLRHAEAYYRLLFDSNPVPLGVYDPETLRFIAVNDAAITQYGYSKEEFLEMQVTRIFPPEIIPEVIKHVDKEIKNSDKARVSVWKNRKKDGTVFWVQLVGHALEYLGKPARIVQAQDITEAKIAQQREHSRSEILEKLAKGAHLKVILETISTIVEQENPEVICSILLLDETGQRLLNGATSSLPDFYNEMIHGAQIGVGVGSCGTAAATGERVIVADIQNHPYWTPYKDIAARANIGACWSTPIRASSGKILGTFAIYHHTPHQPEPRDLDMIDHFTNLAGLAIERHQSEEAMQLAAMVYQNSSEAMLVTDSENKIIAINPAFNHVTGYQLEDVLGLDPAVLGSDRQNQSFFQEMWGTIGTSGKWQGEIWNRRKNGEEYAEWLTINTIYNDDGSVHRRVALFSDITDKKRADALIWNQANFDALTQLPNRRLFMDRLEMEIRKAHRDSSLLGLLFIDMDRFKEVNDTLGHHMGDELLIQAAHRIQHCVRDSDSVARLGGDEFTVILPGLTDIADIGKISQNILESLASPFQLASDQAYISASIGITVYPEDAATVENLLKNADQAMYEAKRMGRNRYSYFTASMQQAATTRMRLVRDIHQALASGQFEVHFQPIIDALTGQIHKAEALLRWKHPQHGYISPGIFIPIAEDTGLIMEIGDWVFRKSIQHLKQWRSQFDVNFQISINKSPIQFRAEDNIHSQWIEFMKESGIPGESIVIEITEGLLLNADESIVDKLLLFRDAGIQVAIDDFGTGYSSLSYLKKFDIDYLKIDQSFIRNLEKEESDLALSEAIIVMAHKLGLKVIAEGVEKQEQANILSRIGCDFLQGYLYAKPLPPEDFEQLLIRS